MPDRYSSSPSVVVGIDGSRAAVDAALWAVDEAVNRDVPLRLVYAIEPGGSVLPDPHDTARELARAEVAVKYAVTAIESTDKPVKIEVEILQDRPSRVLAEASRWATLLCVGSVGLKHSAQGQIGSTAAVLASSARCPVAVVRGHDPVRAAHQWVVAEVDESAASESVLRCALDEARLRDAPLRVVLARRARYTDIREGNAAADGIRLARAHLDRRLAHWKKRYPELDVQAVAVRGTTLNYLSKNADSIQLLVVGHHRAQGITALLGPPGYAALHNANCSVLICEPRNL